MKKIIAILLAAIMLLSVVSCGNASTSTTTTTTTTTTTNNGEGNGNTPENDNDGVIAPSVEEGSMGETLWNAFVTAITEAPEATAEELANVLASDPVIQFAPASMPVEEGAEYFFGFNEYTITGFESAAFFQPMIGSIAFICYVFELPEDADVNTFIKALNDNCNPNWVICDQAGDPVIGAVDNTVFFLMYPIEEAE